MKEKKQLSVTDVTITYIVLALGIIVSIWFWFMPTCTVEYTAEQIFGHINGQPLINYETEYEQIYLFSFSESDPFITNCINIVFLCLSVVSLVLVLVTLFSKKVMMPNSKIIFTTIVYSLYLLLFFCRLMSIVVNIEFTITGVYSFICLFTYALALTFSFSGSFTLLLYRNRLKEQLEKNNESEKINTDI